MTVVPVATAPVAMVDGPPMNVGFAMAALVVAVPALAASVRTLPAIPVMVVSKSAPLGPAPGTMMRSPFVKPLAEATVRVFVFWSILPVVGSRVTVTPATVAVAGRPRRTWVPAATELNAPVESVTFRVGASMAAIVEVNAPPPEPAPGIVTRSPTASPATDATVSTLVSTLVSMAPVVTAWLMVAVLPAADCTVVTKSVPPPVMRTRSPATSPDGAPKSSVSVAVRLAVRVCPVVSVMSAPLMPFTPSTVATVKLLSLRRLTLPAPASIATVWKLLPVWSSVRAPPLVCAAKPAGVEIVVPAFWDTVPLRRARAGPACW